MKKELMKNFQSPEFLKYLEKMLKAAIEKEYGLRSKTMESQIQLEELQPTGLKVSLKLSLQLYEPIEDALVS